MARHIEWILNEFPLWFTNPNWKLATQTPSWLTHTHTHKSTSFLCVDFVCLFGVLKLLCVTPTQANHTLFPLFYACITPERFVIFLGFYTQFNSRPTHIEYYRVQFIHNSKNRNFWKWLRFFYLMLNFPTASEFGCKIFPNFVFFFFFYISSNESLYFA